MTDFWRLYHAGIVLVRHRHALLAAMVVSLGVPSAILASASDTSMSPVSTVFDTQCIQYLLSTDPIDKSALYVWIAEDKTQLQRYFGDEAVRDVWSLPSYGATLIVAETDQPCAVMAFGVNKGDKDEICARILSVPGIGTLAAPAPCDLFAEECS